MSVKRYAFNKNSKSGATINRYLGEAINIGDNIRVTVIGRRGNEVKLLVEAPDEITIRREDRCDTDILIVDGNYNKNKKQIDEFMNKE